MYTLGNSLHLNGIFSLSLSPNNKSKSQKMYRENSMLVFYALKLHFEAFTSIWQFATILNLVYFTPQNSNGVFSALTPSFTHSLRHTILLYINVIVSNSYYPSTVFSFLIRSVPINRIKETLVRTLYLYTRILLTYSVQKT